MADSDFTLAVWSTAYLAWKPLFVSRKRELIEEIAGNMAEFFPLHCRVVETVPDDEAIAVATVVALRRPPNPASDGSEFEGALAELDTIE